MHPSIEAPKNVRSLISLKTLIPTSYEPLAPPIDPCREDLQKSTEDYLHEYFAYEPLFSINPLLAPYIEGPQKM